MPNEATHDRHTEVAANRTAEAAERTKETAVRTTSAAQRTSTPAPTAAPSSLPTGRCSPRRAPTPSSAKPAPTVSIEAGTGRLPLRFASWLPTASSIEEFNGDQI